MKDLIRFNLIQTAARNKLFRNMRLHPNMNNHKLFAAWKMLPYAILKRSNNYLSIMINNLIEVYEYLEPKLNGLIRYDSQQKKLQVSFQSNIYKSFNSNLFRESNIYRDVPFVSMSFNCKQRATNFSHVKLDPAFNSSFSSSEYYDVFNLFRIDTVDESIKLFYDVFFLPCKIIQHCESLREI